MDEIDGLSHINALHRQGKAERTKDSYARAIRRISAFFDLCPDRLTEARHILIRYTYLMLQQCPLLDSVQKQLRHHILAVEHLM